MSIKNIAALMAVSLLVAACCGRTVNPELTDERLQEFVSSLPDHIINLDSVYYTTEYYHAWQDAIDVPSDGLCGIGSEECLWYLVCGNDPCESHSGKLDQMSVKADTAYADFKIIHRGGDESPHTLKLVVRDAQWVIADYDQTLSMLHNYVKEQRAYLQSDEFKERAESILNDPKASDDWKECVRRDLKTIESYFSDNTDNAANVDIDPFYVTNNPHTFRLADTQTVTGMENGNYSVSWYVDTEEWDFDPETNHIFSKIEFKKGDTVLGTFVDDEGWSYFGVENSKAIMFKSIMIDNDCAALVFRGGAYAAGVPNLTIFVICGDHVKLVYNKEYFIGKVDNNRITIQKDYQGPELGTITLSDGHITIVSNEYPTGKIIF